MARSPDVEVEHVEVVRPGRVDALPSLVQKVVNQDRVVLDAVIERDGEIVSVVVDHGNSPGKVALVDAVDQRVD